MAKPYSERIDKLREDTIKKLADDNGLFYDGHMWCSAIGYLKQHCYVKFYDNSINRCFDITFDPSETLSKEIPCKKINHSIKY